MNGQHSLTATNLAVYQHLNCDLYIHNVSSGTTPASPSSGSPGSSSPSEISRAHFKRGLEWETALYSWLDQLDLLLKVPSMPLEGMGLLENILADDRDHFFITGLTFWPPQAKLTEKFKAEGSQPLAFGLSKPDLIEIQRTEDGIVWRVIDAKASRYVKSSHHIQIYFYTLCLNYILEPPHFHGQDSVAVWLPPSDGFHTNPPSLDDIMSISLSLLGPPLDALLFRSLPKVIALPREDVKWHFNPLCHGCRYEPDCRNRAVDKGELGSMPNMSIEDARVLKDLLRMSRPRTQTSPHTLPDIEELHNLIELSELENLKKTSPSVVKKAKHILALPKKSRRIEGQSQSPMIEAARTKKIQVIPRRNFTCPREEDITICISAVNDPSSPGSGGNYFCVTSFSRHRGIQIPPPIYSSNEDFISKLAGLIRTIDSSSHTSQFYVWSAGEHGLLQAHIINAALTSAANEVDIRLCIGALIQGASLLHTTFQPLLLSGALLSFLSRGRKLKADYQKCLSRLGLSTEGSADVLRKRLEEELRRLQDTSSRLGNNEARRKELGQLSKVVILKKEIGRQLALPVPGYWDLPDCVTQLLPTSDSVCPDDEHVLTAYKGEGIDTLNALLARRNDCFYRVLNELRHRAVSASGHTPFVNEAKRLSTQFMDFCTQLHIRKLLFMQQFEVLAKLTELWQTRIDACPEAPTLEYCGTIQGKDGELKSFRVLSGTVDVLSADKDRAFYDKLLVVDTPNSLSDEDNLPVEALFDDLGVSGLVFPLNRFTKSNWTRQDPRIRREVWVADVRNVYSERRNSMVALRTWGTCEASLIPGSIYRLSPRLVDFNTTKILSALFELDLKWESAMDELSSQEQECYPHGFIPFIQLVLDPPSFGQIPAADQYVKTEKQIQSLFRNLRDLGNDRAGSLVLKASQHRATQRIMGNRLSVIWGPPGTGKTYTISLSLLRLIDVERRLYGPQPKVIFVTAITHAAIEACRSKLVRLMDAYRSIANLPSEWLTDTVVEVVSTGNDHPAPRKTGTIIHIYMGTIYQLYNFTKKHALEVDCLIIDEAGQISLCSVSLVLRSLASYGRVIIAGDSEQLAPILSAQYPLLKSHALFGSVLDCLMYSRSHLGDRQERDESQGSNFPSQASTSSQGTVIQLTENFRLNPDLGEFVSTIYSRRFKPQKFQARQLAIALKTVADIGGASWSETKLLEAVKTFLTSLSCVMLNQPQKDLVAPEIHSKPTSEDISLPHRPVSLALIRLRTWSKHTRDISYELHVQAEAALAACLVLCLQKCSPQDDIFVATPHRIQREAVKAALLRIRDTSLEGAFRQLRVSKDGGSKVTVDTIERLQGSEAGFVICLFSVPRTYSVDLAFLLERRRLNVAISRAKTLCILVSSDEVLCPSLKIFANADAAKGYAFLKAFQKRAWSYNIALQVDGFA